MERRIAALKQEIDSDPEGSSRRERAARETAQRAAKARAALGRLQAEKERRKRTNPKDEAKRKLQSEVSITDPEARRMRFSDRAVRAAYNMQIAAHPRTSIVVAIEPTDRRNDSGLAAPMVNDIARRYGRTPRRVLTDTKYATQKDLVILAAHEKGTVEVYAPPPAERDNLNAAGLAKRAWKRAREPVAVKDWRTRMASLEGQNVFRRRKLIELVNAQKKNRGFGVINVCGLAKAKAVALWHALAHNFLAAHRLRGAAA